MADKYPNHTSNAAKKFLLENHMNWWWTLDCNLTENPWHELKEYLRKEVKPKTKQELIDGVCAFWDTVDIAKCTKYIQHLRKVVPKVANRNCN